MKFSVEREAFINILTEYSSILRDIPVKPVVSGLQIKADDEGLTFVGTNLEVNLIRKQKATVTEPGDVVIKPAILLEYIKLIDENEINFSFEDNIVTVHHGMFSVMSDDTFPMITSGDAINAFSIKGSELVKAFERSKFAASQSTDNLSINCLRMVIKNDEMDLVSTDSYRLLFMKQKIHSDIEKEVSVPMDTINIICKLLKDSEKEVKVGFNGEFLVLMWDNAYFTSKTIAMVFPDYKYILDNASPDKTMEFNIDALKRALRSVITVAKTSIDTKYGATFDFRGKQLIINAVSGRAKINQKVDMLKTGDDFKASLNCKFFAEFLDNITKNPIVKGTDSGSMFEVTESGNEDYKYILMPLAMR